MKEHRKLYDLRYLCLFLVIGLGFLTIVATGGADFLSGLDLPPPSFNIVDEFNFTPVTNAPLNTMITSDEVIVKGFSSPKDIHVSSGAYSINGGPFTSQDGKIQPNSRLRVRVLSAPTFDTERSASVKVGETSYGLFADAWWASFSVTTVPGSAAEAPTVRILSPFDQQEVNAQSIQVTGQASDPDGVYSIEVNGIAATSVNGFTTWQAYIPLETGPNVITVASADCFLNRNPTAAQIQIENLGEVVLSSGLFESKLDFAVGNNPLSVAIGDLDGDGSLDLVTANYSSDDVSVLLGNGDGTFLRTGDYGAGDGAMSVAIGDLNGDGAMDLVVGNVSSDFVSVLLGTGDGTFMTAADYGTGEGPRSVAIGDLDGDGALDLVTANYFTQDVSVLLGNGDGTFISTATYQARSSNYSVTIGDLDGDGVLDIAVANWFYVSVLLGNGDGTFQTASDYGAGEHPRSVTIGDLNGDGAMDLAVVNHYGDDISVLLGNGDGTFQTAVNYGVGLSPACIAIGDLDGDGALDLAVVNEDSDDVSVLLGNGDGTFLTATNYGVGEGPYSVAIGDLDGDGALDLATVNSSTDDISVLLTTNVIVGPLVTE